MKIKRRMQLCIRAKGRRILILGTALQSCIFSLPVLVTTHFQFFRIAFEMSLHKTFINNLNFFLQKNGVNSIEELKHDISNEKVHNCYRA